MYLVHIIRVAGAAIQAGNLPAILIADAIAAVIVVGVAITLDRKIRS